MRIVPAFPFTADDTIADALLSVQEAFAKSAGLGAPLAGMGGQAPGRAGAA